MWTFILTGELGLPSSLIMQSATVRICCRRVLLLVYCIQDPNIIHEGPSSTRNQY